MPEAMTLVASMICVISILPFSSGIRYMSICKWTNEGCTTDEDCCSKRCSQAHPGTNSRCDPTDMGGLCLYSFHCGLRMECGERNRCCARHWGTCSKDSDCCVRYHTCQKINGFVYQKCLPKSNFLSDAHAPFRTSLLNKTCLFSLLYMFMMWV